MIANWNGTVWDAQPSGVTNNFRGVWGAGANNVWAVGDWGAFAKWNGTAWAGRGGKGIYEDGRYGVWGIDANNVWTVGVLALQKWDGTAWTGQSIDITPQFLAGGWAIAANNVYVVGPDGSILHKTR
jgi:hypothetical protein